MSIVSWIEAHASTERVAFWFEGQPTTYRQLADRIDVTARGLVQLGVTTGDRVGYCGLNRLELFESMFACARIGAIFVPFNNRLTAGELATQIADSEPKIVVVADGFGDLVSQATAKQAAVDRTVPAVHDVDRVPFAAAAVAQVELPAELDDGDTIVLMVYTSGTTGQAKGAMLSQRAMLHTVLNSIEHQQLTSDDCIIAPLPTFHVGGLNIQTLPTLYVGGQVILQRRFDPAEVLDLVAEHRVTQTLLVPAMLQAVAAQPAFSATDFSSLRGINTGSSIVPPQVMAPYFDRGVPVGQVYGTTETGPTAVVLSYDEAATNIGTCGKPAAHTELRLVDHRGVDVDDGKPGELWLRGPNIFTGYWQNPEATADAFVDGWFRTGDVGYRDANGYVVISDRIKDVVITGGENVYPAEIEPVVAEHPAVVEVAVVGRPDERWGEVPVAVVVLADQAALSVEELRDWCAGRLARFKLPRAIEIVDALPRTALGKVKKHEL